MYTPTGPFYSVPFEPLELRAVLSGDVAARKADLTTVPLHPGTKSVIALTDDLVELFLRHAPDVGLDLPDYVIKALNILVAALDLIEQLNPPGPA